MAPLRSTGSGYNHMRFFAGLVSIGFFVVFFYSLRSVFWKASHIGREPNGTHIATICLQFLVPSIVCALVAIWPFKSDGR